MTSPDLQASDAIDDLDAAREQPSMASPNLKASDAIGALIFTGFAATTALGITLSLAGPWWLWLPGQLILAVALMQWFVLLHEAGHSRLFRRRALNTLAGHVAAYFTAIPFHPWRTVHAMHHRWTGWQDLDPTTAGLVPRPLARHERLIVDLCWKYWIPSSRCSTASATSGTSPASGGSSPATAAAMSSTSPCSSPPMPSPSGSSAPPPCSASSASPRSSASPSAIPSSSHSTTTSPNSSPPAARSARTHPPNKASTPAPSSSPAGSPPSCCCTSTPTSCTTATPACPATACTTSPTPPPTPAPPGAGSATRSGSRRR
ncbi:MAG: fatty acid desaturase [Myxococcales bacterium]|nr:fatty acid desaturase [Myxococcales bacterium]